MLATEGADGGDDDYEGDKEVSDILQGVHGVFGEVYGIVAAVHFVRWMQLVVRRARTVRAKRLTSSAMAMAYSRVLSTYMGGQDMLGVCLVVGQSRLFLASFARFVCYYGRYDNSE
jgi:hypothetical protein